MDIHEVRSPSALRSKARVWCVGFFFFRTLKGLLADHYQCSGEGWRGEGGSRRWQQICRQAIRIKINLKKLKKGKIGYNTEN